MEEEIMKSLRFRQADNNNSNTGISSQAAAQSMAAQMTGQPSIFAGNDAKRMSFDGNMPYNLTSPLGLTSGLLGGGASGYSRDRRDSLKNIVLLDDFGTK